MLTDKEIELLHKRATKAAQGPGARLLMDAEDVLDLIWLASGGETYNSLAAAHGWPHDERVRNPVT